MAIQEKSRAELEREVQELRERLEIAEETLRAITQGEVDALVVSGSQGEQVFTLESADYPYRCFVEEMKEGAATVNSEGMILYCNHPLMSWLKHPLEKIIGSDFKQYIVERDKVQLQHLCQQAQAGILKGELSLRATDGTEIPVQISISSLTMNDVKISGLLVTDLTEQKRNEQIIAARTAQLVHANTQLQQELQERKKVEEALQEKQSLLHSIIEGTTDLIAALDLDFKFIAFNSAYQAEFLKIFGRELQIGTSLIEALTHLSEEQANTVGLWRRALAGEQFTIIQELGARTGERNYYEITYSSITDENGQRIGASHIVKNISDRKQAEKGLELQAVITRNMAEGICLVRVDDGVIVYANPKFERMFGYNPGELNGKHVSIVNYPNESMSAEDVNQAIRREVIQYGEVTYEVHNVKKDGTPFWCRATTSIFDHPEYGTVLVAVHQDITEHKQAEDLIKASLKEKEVLLKEIHHRVKNNLQIITSLLQMQSRRTKEPQAVEVLQDSKNRIASIALVHEKLYRSEDLANINFGQYIPDLTTHLFDTYNVSPNAISLKAQVEEIALQIDTAIPCGLIVNELVSNSLKYAFPGNRVGEIQVNFHVNSDDTLTLIIQDNGIGIPEEFDIETTPSLGLTLVQGLVEQLEGTIELDRSQGTKFKITFPGGKM